LKDQSHNMFYRVHVTVLRAQRPGGLPVSKSAWHDAIACTFGINAAEASDAVQLAVTAARNAFDRNGEFIGGVVVEIACRCVDGEEFDGHEKYFHRPMNEPGIFYVSGARHFGLPRFGNAGALADVRRMKARIKKSGLPPASFVHPRLPDEPPERMRLLCSVCKRWLEVDSDELLSVFMASPLDEFTPEEKKIWRSVNVVGPFMRRHVAQCLFTAGGPRGAMLAIHEPDPRWDTLDPDKQEDDDGAMGQ
jgi:hypothetical protein